MVNKKGNILVLLLGVVLVVSAGIAGYFYWHRVPVPTPPASPTTPDSKTSDQTLTIDFSTCQIEKKRVDVAFGSTTYEIIGKKSGICEINYGGEVENSNWSGKPKTSCQVPISLGKVVFQKNDYGVDFSPIKNYCSSSGCKSNNDCVLGIEINTICCHCPMVVNKDQIGKDGWEVYVKGKDYSQTGENCSKIACGPCQPLDFNPPVCSAGKCVPGGNLPVKEFGNYTCPENGWVNCMPAIGGSNNKCVPEAMKWYKENCPNFQGGAY